MGLDISVYEVIPYDKEKAKLVENCEMNHSYNEKSITHRPELIKWIHLSYKKVCEYLNITDAFNNLGLDEQNYEWTSSGEWTEETEIHNQKEKEKQKLDPSYEIDYSVFDIYHIYKHKNTKEIIKFKESEIPIYTQEEDYLLVKEVGYQRKGANKLFYADDMWNSPCVVDLDTLKKHHEKYFSYQTIDSEGGFGSSVEYDLTDEEMKKRFQENIIDKFIQDKTFVIYH